MEKIKLNIKIFADGADLDQMLEMNKHPLVEGFTTNPSLLRKAGVKNYEKFAKEVVKYIPNKPISFEVIADEFDEMETQARKIAEWGQNIYVKIPVTNTRGEYSCDLINKLCNYGVNVNVTAIFTFSQVDKVVKAIDNGNGFVSVFAGRISDSSVNPEGIIKHAVKECSKHPNQEVIWASTREVYNVIQADRLGCQIITCTPDLIKKTLLFGKNLQDYSLETVKMFRQDALDSGFTL